VSLQQTNGETWSGRRTQNVDLPLASLFISIKNTNLTPAIPLYPAKADSQRSTAKAQTLPAGGGPAS
jgi:hypothetical protein